jgi:hypothetical protein
MSIQIESENLPVGIHNLFPTPLIYENVGTPATRPSGGPGVIVAHANRSLH